MASGKHKASSPPPGEEGPETNKIKTDPNATATLKPTKSNFFSLPAELRNEIYSLVLVTPPDPYIDITPAWKPPPLLSTSHQLRHETKKLYYSNNSFRTPILHCDASLNINFTQHLEKMRLGCPITLILQDLGRANWRNLWLWCRAVHVGTGRKASRLGVTRNAYEENYRTVAEATEVAERMRGVEWGSVEGVLGSLKWVAETMKGEWEDFD